MIIWMLFSITTCEDKLSDIANVLERDQGLLMISLIENRGYVFNVKRYPQEYYPNQIQPFCYFHRCLNSNESNYTLFRNENPSIHVIYLHERVVEYEKDSKITLIKHQLIS